MAALDLPSGVNGDTGEYESCIPADLTVAMGAVKPAHLVNWAGEYMKELALGEIGAHPRVEDAFSGWQSFTTCGGSCPGGPTPDTRAKTAGCCLSQGAGSTPERRCWLPRRRPGPGQGMSAWPLSQGR